LPNPGSGFAGRLLRGCSGGAGATRRANFSGSAALGTMRGSVGIISLQASTTSLVLGLAKRKRRHRFPHDIRGSLQRRPGQPGRRFLFVRPYLFGLPNPLLLILIKAYFRRAKD
jgi:hypothetical protein